METINLDLATIDQDKTQSFASNANEYDLDFNSFNSSASSSSQILFIDSAVDDYQQLIDNLTQPTEVVVLDSNYDGIFQITESLSQYQDAQFEAIHIVSHGDVGELFLGNTQLDRNNLGSYEELLGNWGNSLDANADILLYGCNVGADLAGAEFVQDLSEYTQADIKASVDLTGSDSLGGDWDLEYEIGNVEAKAIFSAENLGHYDHSLNDSIFGDRLDIIYHLDSGGNLVIDSATGNAGLSVGFPRIDYEPTIIQPDPLEIIDIVPFSNFVGSVDSSLLDTIVPPVGSNVPFSFNFGQGNFGIIENNKDYDYDIPELNNWIYNFDASSLQFNPSNFDFTSVSHTPHSLTFGFDFGAFDFSSITSRSSLRFKFENFFDKDNWNNNINFGNDLSFKARSVEFRSNSIKFTYKPGTFKFNRNAFIDNADLFSYKSIDTDSFSFDKFNASDYRALDSAFEGDELFDAEFYANNYSLVPGTNPFADYNDHGIRLGRDPNAVFDNSFYAANNPELVISDISPLEDYLSGGWRAGLPGDPNYDPSKNTNFNPFVNAEDYFGIHEDVRIESLDPNAKSPLEDLMAFGFTEGRIFNKALQADNVAKVNVTLTPDSDPTLISQTTEAIENNGFDFRLTEDGESFEIAQISPVDDILNPYTAVAVTLGFITGVTYLGYKTLDELSDAIEFGTYDFSNAKTTGSATSVSITPIEAIQSDVVSIDYGNPELEELLGSRPFPGQTESQRTAEIFRPPFVDGVEDFSVLPVGEQVIIPRTTGFPQGDALLEDLLNGGVFTGGGDELAEGAYVLASTNNGELVAYNPEDFSNLPNNSFDSIIQNGGRLNTILGRELPVRESLPPRIDPFTGEEISQQTHGSLDPASNRQGRINIVSGKSDIGEATRARFITPSSTFLPYPGEPLNSTQIKFRVREAFRHVEGSAASTIRALNAESGTLVINNSDGPCFRCVTGVPRILPDGATLTVIYETAEQIITDTFVGGQLFNEDTDRKIEPIDF